MPEGPEAKIMAENLYNLFFHNQDGRTNTVCQIERVEVVPNKAGKPVRFKGFTAVTYPAQITNVRNLGKKIIFDLTDKTGQAFFMATSLAMDGRWQLAPSIYCKVALYLRATRDGYQNRFTLYYNDMRYGRVVVYPKEEEHLVTKDIGPNLLESALYLEKNGKYEIPFSLFKEIYRSKRAQNKQLCQALLDQSLISGIGNYLKCEILYACRLAPDRLVKACSDVELRRIWRIGHKTILKAYKYNGLTIRTYTDLAGKLGHFPVIVYRKAGQYTRTGHLIVYSKFKDGRGTYWVPDLQK